MAKKKTAETANIKAAPVLRSSGEQPTPTPEQTGTRTYQIMDPWKDRDVVNLVDVKAVDGEITEVKVNGEPAGGGGGGMFSTAVLTATATPQSVTVPHIVEGDGLYNIISDNTMAEPDHPLTIVLVNGMCLMTTDPSVTVTGSAEVLDPDEGVYKVTGNVTLS